MSTISFCDISFSVIDKRRNLSTQYLNKYANRRILVGSYFCDRFFLDAIDDQIAGFCGLLKPVSVGLVLPVFRNEYLDVAKSRIKLVVGQLGSLCEEITVNDPGMLIWASASFRNHRIVLGRLFYKNSRDPRVPWYRQGDEGDFITNAYHSFTSIATPHAIEVDTISQPNVSTASLLPIAVRMHRPLSFLATGFTCKSGSIHVPTNQKFRPATPCRMECCNIVECSHWGEPPTDLIRIGRTVFVIVDSVFETSESLIWWPLLEIIDAGDWITENEVACPDQ